MSQQPKFTIEFADHPEYGPITSCIEEADIEGPVDADAMIDAVKQVLTFASLAVAGRFVDYDAFRSDQEYMARNTELAGQLMPSAMRLVPESVDLPDGAEASAYLVSGLDSEQREFTGTVRAFSVEDAKFQARWMMALAGAPGIKDLEGHIADMERSIVQRCETAPELDPGLPQQRF